VNLSNTSRHFTSGADNAAVFEQELVGPAITPDLDTGFSGVLAQVMDIGPRIWQDIMHAGLAMRWFWHGAKELDAH